MWSLLQSVVSAAALGITSGSSDSNLGLKIGLPVALGVLLALLLLCCLWFGCRVSSC